MSKFLDRLGIETIGKDKKPDPKDSRPKAIESPFDVDVKGKPF